MNGLSWKSTLALALLALIAAGSGPQRAVAVDATPRIERLRQEVQELLASPAKSAIFAGTEGWLFQRAEIQGAAGLGPWPPPPPPRPLNTGKNIEPVVVIDAARTDALAAVDDFATQLRQRGIPLLFVLIPPKFHIYPDRLFADADPQALDLGEAQRHFLEELVRRRIAVVDLGPPFLAERQRSSEPLYAAQDTHWTSHAARLAARQIGASLHAAGVRSGPGMDLVEQATVRDDCGDLWGKLAEPRPPCTALTLHSLHAPGGEQLAGTVARESPILLLGDSSSLVYHESRRAGLVDHLAREMGEPIDLVAVTAGGANSAREALARRGNGLDGKKVVVWVVSGRLLYQYPAWKKMTLAGETQAAGPTGR